MLKTFSSAFFFVALSAPSLALAAPERAPGVSQAVSPPAQPPAQSGVEWVKVSFEKAENELLSVVKKDLPELARKTSSVVLYEVQVEGPLPSDYSQTFRSKLEKVLMMESALRLKDCPGCEQSRLIRKEDGRLQYESQILDPKRASRIASELGVTTLLHAQITYTQEDLRLNLKLVDSEKNDVLWSRDYSTEEYLRDRDGRFRLDPEGPGDLVREGDSLSHVMLGEIAFTMALSPGAILMPTIDRGAGADRAFYPAVDLLIGERYNRGYDRFGFVFGAAFNMASGISKSQGLAFLARVGPNFRHTFNPYNVTSARYSMVGEGGVAIGPGLTTPYVGLGAEISMIRRFSVTCMPMYFLTSDVSQEVAQEINGEIVAGRGPVEGRFGGLGVMLKGNITW